MTIEEKEGTHKDRNKYMKMNERTEKKELNHSKESF